MSLPWFALYADLPDHPKSQALGDELGNPMAWAHVVALWSWCSKFNPAGRFDGPAAGRAIERNARWAGKAGRFVDAAIVAGFLDRDDGGGDGLTCHNFHARNQSHLTKVEKDRERMRARRSGVAERADLAPLPRRSTEGEVSRDCSATNREQSRDCSATVAEMSPNCSRIVAGESETESDSKKEPSGEVPPVGFSGTTDDRPTTARPRKARTKGPSVPDEPDKGAYLARYRALFGGAADFTKQGVFVWRSLREKHGMPALMRALEGCGVHQWTRENRTLDWVCSQAGVEFGSKSQMPAAPRTVPLASLAPLPVRTEAADAAREAARGALPFRPKVAP